MAKKQPFIMNLQLFADTQPQQEPVQQQPSTRDQALAMFQSGNTPEGAAPTQGQPQPTGDNPQNSPQNSDNSGQPTGQTPNQEPTQGQPGQQAPNSADQMILGKFKSPEELASAYANLEKFNTQTRQELSQVQQAAQAAQTAVLQMQQQMQNTVNAQPQDQQQPQLSPDEQNEQFMNSFYENPMTAIQSIIEKAVMPQIQPMQQQYQAQQQQQAMDQAISQFAQQTPDFQQFSPSMSDILSQNPELNQHDPLKALGMAYQMAKGQNYQDPNSLLQNQDFVKQNILGNQDIKNQIIQEYLQGLQQGNQAPTVINGQPGGQTTVVPQSQPNTIKDARNIALQYFKK